MGKPDTPAPPNPIQTAQAQTSTNVQTAVANAFLNNMNQVTPYGALDYTQTGSYTWTDPSTSQTYTIPRFTSTQTLTPQGQAIENQKEATQLNLAGMANAQSGKIANLLGSTMDLSGAPDPGSAAGLTNIPSAATSYGSGGPIQNQLGPTGAIRASTYGPNDFSADRDQIQNALMSRMQPQLDVQKNKLQQQLADQGIRYGSQAYNDAMLTFNQQQNDAWMSSVTQSANAQQQMINEAAQQAAFQNQAQQQEYEQNLGRAGFANQAQAQQYQQNAAAASFNNAGLAQQMTQQQAAFNASQAARNQYMQEQYAQRNQPINEITSLLSGSQVQQPNFITQAGNQIPTTDIANLINQNFNQQMQNYQTQSQSYNTLVGGILGLGAGALKLSDKREKEDIHRIGSIFAAGPGNDSDNDNDELPIYSYRYKESGQRDIGPMAQDVERVDPATVRHIAGRKYIDQARLMGNILKAA